MVLNSVLAIAAKLIDEIGTATTSKLIVATLVATLFDLIGIGLTYPYIAVLMQPAKLTNELEKHGISITLSFPEMALLLGGVLVLFFVLKMLLQHRLLVYQYSKLAALGNILSNRVTTAFLSAEMAYFDQRPASEVAGLMYSCPIHATIFLRSVLTIIAESIFISCVLVFGLFSNPSLTLVVLIFLLVLFTLMYALILRSTSKIGESLANAENNRYRFLYFIARTVKEIKIMGLGDQLSHSGARASAELSDIWGNYNARSTLPLAIIELVVLLGFVAFVIFIALSQGSLEKNGPLMAALAVVAIRSAPGVARLVQSLNSCRFYRASVANLYEEIGRLSRHAQKMHTAQVTFESIIEVRSLSYRFGEKFALKDVNLMIAKGAEIGIVGPSGSGKSTLLEVLTGLRAADGEFLIDGTRIDPFESKDLHRLIGYVPQAVSLLDRSMAFNIALEETPDMVRLASSVRRACLDDFVKGLPNGLETRMGEGLGNASGGQRHRIGIARALYRNPQILILDEATSALDPITEAELMAQIEQIDAHVTKIIVSHRLTTVRGCDVIYVFQEGTVVAKGTHHELLNTSEIYRNMWLLQDAATAPSIV